MPHDSSSCSICSEAEFSEFRHRCIHESIDQNKQLSAVYKFSEWSRWDYQMEDRTLIFSEDGKPRVICEMEVAGSTEGNTWQWSWSNPNLPAQCCGKMCVVHEVGEEREWDRMTTAFLPNDEYVGWECAGIASHLLGGIGVYRGPSSNSKREDGLVDAVYIVILSAAFVT